MYEKMDLTSAETARFIVTFRPPASHPRFIHNFIFVFSHTTETIVFEAINDKVGFSSSFLTSSLLALVSFQQLCDICR